jgi:hypothetical protein
MKEPGQLERGPTALNVLLRVRRDFEDNRLVACWFTGRLRRATGVLSLERVVKRAAGFLVVEKLGEGGDVARDLDSPLVASLAPAPPARLRPLANGFDGKRQQVPGCSPRVRGWHATVGADSARLDHPRAVGVRARACPRYCGRNAPHLGAPQLSTSVTSRYASGGGLARVPLLAPPPGPRPLQPQGSALRRRPPPRRPHRGARARPPRLRPRP